jgi:YD repeat-containing protein
MKLAYLLFLIVFQLIFVLPSFAATYIHDELGRLKTVTYSSGKTVTYSYDAAGNIISTSMTIPNTPPAQFIVTPTTGSGFTITPATPQTINNNATTSFTVTPASGYGIASVSGCGGSLTGSAFTTGSITADCTISVTAVARNASSGTSPTINDALKVLQAVVGITPLTATERIRYDVAPLSASGTPLGNGVIDAADVILILRRSIGIGSW